MEKENKPEVMKVVFEGANVERAATIGAGAEALRNGYQSFYSWF